MFIKHWEEDGGRGVSVKLATSDFIRRSFSEGGNAIVAIGKNSVSLVRSRSPHSHCFFVVPTGIEPVTQGFSVLCSTN